MDKHGEVSGNECRASGEDPRVRRTRESLMEALLELTIEKGYSRTKVGDVLERADVARSTFYNHFADKDDLLLGRFSLFRLEPVADDGSALPLPDVTGIFSHTALYSDLYRSLRDGGDLEPIRALAMRDLTASYGRVFEDLAERGYRLRDEPRFLAGFYAGALIATLFDWLEAGAPGSPQEMGRRFQEQVARGAMK